MPPPEGNILQRAARAGRAVVSIGKVGDIFAHRDTGDERKGKSNDGNVDLLLEALATTARRRTDLRQSGRFRHRMGPSPRCPRLCGLSRSLRSTARRHRSGDAAAPTIASSPPTTATIRLSAALTTRASTFRSSPSAPGRARPDRSPVELGRRRRDDRGQARPAARDRMGAPGPHDFALDDRLPRRVCDAGQIGLATRRTSTSSGKARIARQFGNRHNASPLSG